MFSEEYADFVPTPNILCFVNLRQLQNIQKRFFSLLKLMKLAQHRAKAKTNSYNSGFVADTLTVWGGSCIWSTPPILGHP